MGLWIWLLMQRPLGWVLLAVGGAFCTLLAVLGYNAGWPALILGLVTGGALIMAISLHLQARMNNNN